MILAQSLKARSKTTFLSAVHSQVSQVNQVMYSAGIIVWLLRLNERVRLLPDLRFPACQFAEVLCSSGSFPLFQTQLFGSRKFLFSLSSLSRAHLCRSKNMSDRMPRRLLAPDMMPGRISGMLEALKKDIPGVRNVLLG